MRSVRIGAGLGFYGDSWQPVLATLERGDVQYIASDHLAELTLAILQKDRAKSGADAGYTRDLLPMLTALWPAASKRGVKFLLNAGGLNPPAAAAALRAEFARRGWPAKIATVTGDAQLDHLDALIAAGEPLAHLDSGADIATVRDRLVFANAYLGARPLVDALAAGADIVICGRVADAALFMAPLIHEFGWAWDDWNRLAQALTVGHLLECSGQGSGGNFNAYAPAFAGGWKGIPDYAHLGFPIAEVHADGRALITKAPDTGGRVDFDTLRQQLLYEVHNPHRYISPDVILDMGSIRLEDLGGDRVKLSGASGAPRPDKLKIVAGYEDGWAGSATIGYSWPQAVAKARTAEKIVRQLIAERGLHYEEIHSELLGLDSLLGPLADLSHADKLNEVYLRMVVRTPERKQAEAFPRLFPWLGLSGPPTASGFSGIEPARALLGLWPTLAARELIEPGVQVELTEVAP